MILFTNDYNRGAHPTILEALARDNTTSHAGYGQDDWCGEARAAIAAHLGGMDADIHFLTGGTQVNATITAAGLRPYQSVVSATTGHIVQHETGAVEHGGHKVEVLPTEDGKITASAIAECARAYADSAIAEHITWPRMVYLSFPTEYGSLYSLAELTAISGVCHAHDLLLFVDGARLGYGLGASTNDVTMADLARLTDAFTIGGTKCGALFGEAAVLVNLELRTGFRHLMKQHGALLAKGWLLGLQFATLFAEDRYFTITRRADELAGQLAAAFTSAGIKLAADSSTNQLFVVLTSGQMAALGTDFGFEYWEARDGDRHCVRFCTSWSTREDEVAALCRALAAL